ncbi:MAG: TonB-dependent receptor, partial [Alphaproteobacteria bacterium]|nr:TonB-dependent receptor [Alphaproteobacteria bacterium]
MKRALLAAAFILSFPALATAATIGGTLDGADGKPLPPATVKLQNGRGHIAQSVTTDAKGHYFFKSVGAGSYVLLATKKDAVLASASVSVNADSVARKDMSLAAAPVLNVVIAQRRDFRNGLSPKTGTSAYRLDRKAIAALPQGADTSLNKVLLQTPGVAEDSAASGSLHIRGEHGNVQYRLNGILLPEGIDGFGNMIDTHIVDSVTLLDGALPAQYGFHTAGVVDIETKNGFANGGAASVMGGSNDTIQPSVSYGGTTGSTAYFVSASHLSSDLGIENPTSGHNAIHDHTEQDKQFGYASYMINPMQNVEIIAGNSISHFEIPNNPGQTPANGYQYNGISSFNSADLNERQFESNQYFTAAWQGENDGVQVQIAPFIRNSETHFTPDTTGDLLFNGVASDVKYTDLVTGLQNDNSWRIDAAHTLRMGFSAQNDHVNNDSTSLAFTTAGGAVVPDGSGNDAVTSVVSNKTKDGQLYGLYLQDEWKIDDALTLNYGARFDDMEQYVSANQLSPRIGLVYKATPTTTLHAGYARTFTPPPMELVSNGDIAAFANTTNAATVTQNSPVKPERANDFDVGVTQKIGSHWQVGADGYYKLVHDLL